MTDHTRKAIRLQEIQQEIKDLIREARQLTRGTPEENRARSYWLAHLTCALDRDHGYLGSSMVTMQDTIDALEEGAPDDEPPLGITVAEEN